jgi:hypothetical protein
MPYISATAEIMYAPLDFRLVIGPEPTLTNLQQNKAATDRHGFPPDQKTNPCSRVPNRGRGLLSGWRKMASKLYFCASSARNLGLRRAPIEYAIEVNKGGCHEGLL